MPIYFSLNTEYMKIYPIYLTTTGTYYKETERDRPEGFAEYQFILTVEGEGIFEYLGNRIKITPGTLLFIPPCIKHSYYKTGDKWVTHWLAFDGNNIEELFDKVLPKTIEFMEIGLKDKVESQLIEVNKLTYEDYQSNALKISAIIYTMIGDFVHSIQNKYKTETLGNISYVNNVIKYMESNYSKDISLEELAESVDVSPQYLCRIFKRELGLRPFEYLKMLRINLSKTFLLEHNNKKIEDIARDTGFNNSSYFGSVFRQYENMTPREFIRLHKM